MCSTERLLLGRLHWRVLLRDGLIGLPGKRRWTKVGSILGFVSLSFSEREICVWLEDFSVNFGDHRNKYYNAGQMEDRDACKEVLKNVFVFKTYIFPLNSTCMQKGGSSQGDYWKVMSATQIVKDNFFCLWLLTRKIFLRKTIRNTKLKTTISFRIKHFWRE